MGYAINLMARFKVMHQNFVFYILLEAFDKYLKVK